MKCSECVYCYKGPEDLFPCCQWNSEWPAPCEEEKEYEEEEE